MEVLVEHDYVAKESNELTITKGDIIKDVVRRQGGWLEGTLKDKTGLFPDNFVKVIDKDSVVLRNRKDASRIRQCRVVFSYKQDHEDELNLNVGDVIDILGEEEEGWWRGVLNGKQGVFPSNFVEEITPSGSKQLRSSRENLTNSVGSNENLPPLHAKPAKTLCEVKFPYKAQNEDELTLKEGDLVILVSKDGQDPGWWKGELNGVVGVFPDNFVTILSSMNEDTSPRDEKRAKSTMEQIKPNATSTQRKSLELQNSEKLDAEAAIRTTPPLPGKKPNIPIKKSPSGSGSTGGIFYGIKRKIADVVDGATGSKISPPKAESKESAAGENVFDDVHRRPLLADVRATRPKAPGRRPPSIVGKDPEPGMMNGNTDHVNVVESLAETTNTITGTSDGESVEIKPKLPEWVKHPAPWLEEMRLNQAKRSSSVTGGHDKPKQTSEKNEIDDNKTKFKKEASPVDKSKSIPNLRDKIKTPPNDFPMIRNKPNVPIPTRPQTIQNIPNSSDVNASKPQKMSPISNIHSSPVHKTENFAENATGDGEEDFSSKTYAELRQRIAKLEEIIEKQQQTYDAAIEELRGKLQIEAEMRMKLQAKFERFALDDAIQQL